MNPVNPGITVDGLSLFSAALVLALGLWTGRRQAGFQGMWQVLGTVAVVTVLRALMVPPLARANSGSLSVVGQGFSVGAVLSWLLLQSLAFLPLLVAALQVGVLQKGSSGSQG